ncbi:MAG TPA: YDG domain-containing protein [Planctomycetaceae bacterium]|nr:YDG domain-containing protein [Planctomycetaceae bacterium]
MAVVPADATGVVSLFLDGRSTAIATHTLTAGDNGSFTFDVGVLNAGAHSLHAVYAATGNFVSSTADGSLVVAQASASISALGYSVTYDGKSHTAPVTATGVGGIDLGAGLTLTGTVHTSAGTYGDAWSFHDAGGNYADASGTVIDSIAQANAAINVTGYSVTFDGTAHTATGAVTGAGGVDLSAGLTLAGTTHTNAGANADAWTFHDASGNYNDTSGFVDDSIAKANAAINVTGYNVTFDGESQTAAGAATGVAGADLSAGLTLTATSHANAGTYTDTWMFHDSAGNYNDAAGTVTDAIAMASAVIAVSGYNVTFDGNSHVATGTATGFGNVDLTAGLTLTGTTHTNAGAYADTWTFHDASGNYSDASSTVSDNVAKANATINVTGFSGTYDGAFHGATGTATGVGGANLGGQLNLGAAFQNVPGGTAHWIFSGSTNYNDAAGDVSIVISARLVTGSITTANKVFDGTTTATINGTSLAGTVAGDDVHLTVGPANFASANVGTWTVTGTGLGLSGAAAGNYALASTTATTTASITSANPPGNVPQPLTAILSTAPVVNIANNGFLIFKFSNVGGIANGESVSQLFNGVQFSLKIGSKVYSVKSTAYVFHGSIYVAWRIDPQLHAALAALLDPAAPSAKTTISLQVFATSSDGKYTLGGSVQTRIFQQRSAHDNGSAYDHSDVWG